MKREEFEQLLKRYNRQECSVEEKQRVEKWYAAYLDEGAENFSYKTLKESQASIFANVMQEIQPAKRIIRLKPLLKAAAAIAIVGMAAYFTYQHQQDPLRKVIPTQVSVETASPGKEQATLTLANGKVITLHNVGNDTIENQNGIYVRKNEKGELEYVQHAGSSENSVNLAAVHTLQTPIGGKYSLSLADGSKVILNANSSITFPERFDTHKRVVHITGEVYFDIAKQKNGATFIVHAPQQEVEVLGTKFVVSSYPEEPYKKTALITGKVKVKLPGQREGLILRPGEKSISIGQDLYKSNTAIDSDIAWVNNDFHFVQEDLQSIMRQLARWYNIDVIYQTSTEGLRFSGAISREKPLNEILHIISSTQKIKFKTIGRKVFVQK